MRVELLGDAAVVLHLDGAVDAALAARVRAIAAAIGRGGLAGATDIVPAFASVAVFFERAPTAAFAVIEAELRALVAGAGTEANPPPGRVLEVPVVYGGEHGPDLGLVAAHTGLTEAEVVARHAAGEYLVHAIGFAPGFPYLGGLDPRLATPRRATPRALVAAGSVGIGGAQTGVYPLASPGGWNLIGRTPLALFDPRREPAALLSAGDRVRFRAVAGAEAEFAERASAASPSGCAADIEVLRAGMFTTVQDAGRRGHRAAGVPLSGAADPLALRLANLIAGNDETAAGLECTLVGPTLRFHRDTVIAWGGASTAALPSGRPVVVRAGETLTIGALPRGCRGYLAMGGGVTVPAVLGSRSTLVRAGLGGVDGRELRDGDGLQIGEGRQLTGGRWRIDERILPHYSAAPTVRVVAGAHARDFQGWEGQEFSVSTQSDRMGVRLGGAVARRGPARELISTPVAPGTIQVPPDGAPIVLLSDAQTIGGYPQLAHVITADLPLVAQLRPGDAVRFVDVSLEEARRAAGAVERALGLLREGLARKFL
ncbi:MAG: 5-oxoprolinase subunit PxpB [Opitutaceae bacterium]|nr:5-oxoprolinase subunit PxpB [Opitutaceae bacterium]